MTPAGSTLEDRLAAAVLSAGERIPPHVLDRARVLVGDSVAISLAASRLSVASRAAAGAVAAGIDAASSHVFGANRTTSPSAAAFANSAHAHALDFDDTHDLARLHTTTVVLPAALAVGELCGASGDRVMRSVVLGAELMCLLGLSARPTATSPAAMWFMTQLTGYIGAAVAAAVSLNLDVKGVASAISFAYAQAAGGKQAAMANGSEARSIYPAFAAAGGVTAALLAQSGLTGPRHSLDGPTGLWSAYLHERLTEDVENKLLAIGSGTWEFEQIAVKPWPSCRLAHPYIDAVRSLPEFVGPIETITLGVNASVARLCLPAAQRRRPTTLPDAGFSVPYMTALALARGDVRLIDFTPGLLEDSAIWRLVDLIEIDGSLEDGPGNPDGVVSVTVAGHTIAATGMAYPSLTDAEVRTKAAASLEVAGLTGDPLVLWDLVDSFGESDAREFMTGLAHWCTNDRKEER